MTSRYVRFIENVPLRDIEPRPRLFSVLLFIGQNDGTYADALHDAGFKKNGIFGVLDYLLDLKLINDSWEASDRGGGARRMYRLTPLGQQVYEHLVAIDRLLK